MAVDTIFDVRSITKPVTAIAALILVAESKLALDSPVGRYFPEVARFRTRTPMVLRHLLTHSAGLPQERPPELANLTETRDRPLRDVVAILTQGGLVAEPGERWIYSSPGFALLGRIVEIVSGHPFHRFVSDRILNPLGMKDSFFHPTPKSRARLASLYSWDKEGSRLEPWSRVLPADRWPYDSPDFGLYSTAENISRLLRSMFPESRSVLPRALKQEMLSPQIETGTVGLYQGLGWFVSGDDGLCESLGIGSGCFGATGAGGSIAWADPARRRTVVYLQQVFFGSHGPGLAVARSTLCQVPNADRVAGLFG